MKKQTPAILLMVTLGLSSSIALAQNYAYQDYSPSFIPVNANTKPTTLPKGVCVFDIDNTLKAKSSSFKGPPIAGGHAYLSVYAQQAVHECVENGFGVAINTAYNKLPTQDKGRREFLEALFAKNAKFAPEVGNAIYQDFMHGSKGVHAIYLANEDSGHKKAQAMSDIMQAYFGSKESNWLTKYKAKSQCAVLFDDNANNRAGVLQYDKDHGLKFLAQAVDGNTGLTQKTFEASFDKLKQSCS